MAAFVGLSLLSSPAVAGEKEEARRHFKNGMQLLQEGQYEKGIAELKEAYAILPHANVLYNIARAYAESGDLESSVAYYRKYLAENPPDKEEVEAVVRSLEARLAKSKAAAAAAAFDFARRASSDLTTCSMSSLSGGFSARYLR